MKSSHSLNFFEVVTLIGGDLVQLATFLASLFVFLVVLGDILLFCACVVSSYRLKQINSFFLFSKFASSMGCVGVTPTGYDPAIG